MEHIDPRWRKASYSGNGGNCVEVGQGHDGTILLRDTTQDGRGPVHRYPAEAWRAFVAQIKAS